MSNDVAESNAVVRSDGDTENTQVSFNWFFLAFLALLIFLIDLKNNVNQFICHVF